MAEKHSIFRSTLDEYKFSPKKSLGQNFLVDKNIALKIISASCIVEGKSVIEIGPGLGALTQILLDLKAKVYAVEIDNRLYKILSDRFGNNKNFNLIKSDILDFEPGDLDLKEKAVVIGNLPFYISSQIIAKFLPHCDCLESIFVTIQKELAQRILTPGGNRQTGALSLFAQFFSKPEILFNISKTCFRPIPKVDASFMRFSLIEAHAQAGIDKAVLFLIIRTAFKYRRKTIFNALRNSFDVGKLSKALANSGIDAAKRPEAITLEQYINLAASLK